MKEGLDRFGAVSERAVHDLWPLGVMRRRAGAAEPAATVVRPGTYEQVAALLRWATQDRVTVVPLGGGSGVCGALEAAQGEVVVDLGGLDRILAIEDTDLVVHAQAGVNGMRLEQELNGRGLTLGHFPSSLPVTTVGGLVSTRSSGQESSRYGHVEEMVLGLTVALADGSILAPRPGPRSAAGPALHELLVGAEGGLGVVLDARLRVHRRPEEVIGGGFAFPDVAHGLEAMRTVIQAGIRPLVIRLYDAEDTALQGLDVEGCLMVAACAGPSALARAEWSLVQAEMSGHGGSPLGESVWDHWRDHRFSLSAERMLDFLSPPGAYVDTIEVASAWSRLPEVYGAIKAGLVRVAQIALCHFAHPEDQGCCAYFTFGGSAPSEAEAEAAYHAAWTTAMEAALTGGATISHHHGVGQAHAAWIQREMGGWWGVWESVRKALDPGAILNPNALGGRGLQGPRPRP